MSQASTSSRGFSGATPWSILIVQWATRRRIAISLVGFTSLVLINVFVVRNIPCNPTLVTNPQVALSLAVIAIGLMIRTWSAGTLNKSREVTATGPYAIVRNPLYIGSFLMMVGFCVMCHDWGTLLFAAGPVTWLYWIQIRVEEERLSQLFPSQWPAYMKSVPRFIPRQLTGQAFHGWSLSMWWRNREYRALGASLLSLAAIYGWYWLSQV